MAERAARAAGNLMRDKVGAKVIRTKAFAADLLTEVDQPPGTVWVDPQVFKDVGFMFGNDQLVWGCLLNHRQLSC